MSNIEIALTAVSLVIAGACFFSIVWYPIEKREAARRKKEMEVQEWSPSLFAGGHYPSSTYLRPTPHDLITSEPRR